MRSQKAPWLKIEVKPKVIKDDIKFVAKFTVTKTKELAKLMEETARRYEKDPNIMFEHADLLKVAHLMS